MKQLTKEDLMINTYERALKITKKYQSFNELSEILVTIYPYKKEDFPLKASEDLINEELREVNNFSLILEEWLNFLKDKIDKKISNNIYEIFKNVVQEKIKNFDIPTYPVTTNIEKEYPINLLSKKNRHDCIISLEEKMPLLLVLWSLGQSSKNTVVLGANGSGKSFLINLFKAPSFQSIAKRYSIIPAERPLKIFSLQAIKTQPADYNPITESIRNPINHYSANVDQFYQLFSSQIDEYISSSSKYRYEASKSDTEIKRPAESLFEQSIRIWNDIMSGYRALEFFHENLYELHVTDVLTGSKYQIYSMSDGEKSILFLIMIVLQAPSNSFVLVDEPEVYLHKSIINKLWNKLEYIRNDCQFIYLTHDVDFASTRNATKLWLKSFTYPNKWDIQEIKENEIPQELYMMLLGSRRPILFCEGEKNSLDIRIYELLYPELTITPVASCKDVINCTRAFNSSKQPNLNAFGVIDRDHRSIEQIEKCRKENIFTLEYSEIENILLDENLLNAVGKRCNVIDLQNAIINIKQKIIDSLNDDTEMLVSRFIATKIEYEFQEGSIKGKTKSDITKSFSEFQQNIDIDKIYLEKEKVIQKIITNNDYAEIIKKYNNKGLKKHIPCEFKISNYEDQAVDCIKNDTQIFELLRNNACPDLIGALKKHS